jgi:hypothetical protein
MASRRLLARGTLAGTLFICALLTACASAPPPFVVALPNGYYLQRDRASNVELVTRAGRTLVQGPIAAYAVANNVIAGCVGNWPPRPFGYPNETPFPDSPDCRYFILDTPTGRMEKDLSPATWRSQLKQYGAPDTLRITAPVLPL